jgi:hypothetical protein
MNVEQLASKGLGCAPCRRLVTSRVSNSRQIPWCDQVAGWCVHASSSTCCSEGCAACGTAKGSSRACCAEECAAAVQCVQLKRWECIFCWCMWCGQLRVCLCKRGLGVRQGLGACLVPRSSVANSWLLVCASCSEGYFSLVGALGPLWCVSCHSLLL